MTTPTLRLSDLAGPDANGFSDVAVFVRADGSESEPFVVVFHCSQYGTYYQQPAPFTQTRIPTPSLYPVRRLGRGRLRPACIVIEGEATGGPQKPECDCSAWSSNECACGCGSWPEDEVRRLAAWKAQQLAVEAEWDAQAVGRLLNVPPGQSIRAAIQPGVEALQEQVATLRETLQHIESMGQTAVPDHFQFRVRTRSFARAALAATAPKPTEERR